MASPIFDANLFRHLLNTTELRALTKFISKSASIESFITRTHIFANQTVGTSVRMNTCIFVLEFLERNGYLRSASFKNPYTYNGKELLNYYPTDKYPTLLVEGAKLPDEKVVVKQIPIEIDETLKVSNFQLEVTGKYYHLMKSASNRNKDFNLTKSDVRRLLERKTCFYTGLPFVAKDGSPYVRTIDRVDSDKGYVKGNVVACCKMANEFKNQLLENGNGLSLNKKVIKRMLTLFLVSLGENDD